MPPAIIWRRRLRPAFVAGELRRVGKKIQRKIRRPEREVVHLEPAGTCRGRALVSYIIDGLLLPPDELLPRSHTHFWESRQIARTFAELGFEVDVIHWTNFDFRPTDPYDVFLDVRLNLERLAPLVGNDCLKIQHMETAHHSFHNRAQLERLARLERRRGVRIRPQKLLEENRAIETADVGITVGNGFTIGTYAHSGKPIYRVPISVPCTYPSPEDKDFDRCRRSFLWFGSGGLVHKGLDLVLEAFATMPDYRLTVCGPVHLERDFEAAYARELYQTANIETVGWVDVAGDLFRDICDRTLGLVYPSCSEGCSGGLVTCLHAGLLPIITPQTGFDPQSFVNLLAEPTVETIREAVAEFAARPTAELRRSSREAWTYARKHHTREAFAESYRSVVQGLLDNRATPDRSAGA